MRLMYICIYTYVKVYMYISIYKYVYIHTRNYALAIASTSFPPGSHGSPLGITLGSRISKPKDMILDPKIMDLNRFSHVFYDLL